MQILYVILLIASFFFYILYEGAISFYLFAFLFVLPISLAIINKYTADRISVSFKSNQIRASKNYAVPIILLLENKSPFPALNVMLEIEYSSNIDKKPEMIRINTPVYQNEIQRLTLQAGTEHCGIATMKIKRSRCFDMLKLFRMKIGKFSNYQNNECSITILPEYTLLNNAIQDYSDIGADTEEYSHNKKGDDPSEIFNIHEYTDGDKISRIHWKLSAKQDKTMVKDYSLPLMDSVAVFVDISSIEKSNNGIDVYDAEMNLTASVSKYLADNNIYHRVVWYKPNSEELEEYKVTDEETHIMCMNSLLNAGTTSKKHEAIKQYCEKTIIHRFGHIIYISTDFNQNICSLFTASGVTDRLTYVYVNNSNDDVMTDKTDNTEIIYVNSKNMWASLEQIII